MTSPFDRCAVCGGTNEEHNEITKHVFTDKPGDLRLKPVVTERQNMKEPDSGVEMVSRLVEILVEKEIVTFPEALVVFGIKEVIPEEAPNARDGSEQRT